MKKVLYITLLACAPLVASAQSISITQADAPVAGETWVQLEDTRPGEHQITAGGANQTWNYANAFMVTDTTAIDFISASSVPSAYSSGFPGASLAQFTPSDSIALFFKKNASGFYLDGIGVHPNSTQAQFVGPAIRYNPDLMIMPTPITYNDTRTHTARMVLDIPAGAGGAPFPMRFAVTTYQTFTADAYGSLTTPSGTYPNTLRVRQFSYSIDTTYANTGFGFVAIDNNPPSDTAISYNWYKNGPGTWLMSINAEPTAPTTSESAFYLNNTINAAPVFVSAPSPLLVYPNPVGNHPVAFEITDPQAHKLVITDVLGREIRSEYVNGINTLSLSTQSFQNGTYVYMLRDKAGRTLNSGRFVVAR